MNTAFGSWPSPLTTQELTRGVTGFADLQSAASSLFLLESRPEEAGRSTVVMLNPQQADDPGIEISPAPFNVRSRVHEYGGGSFLATQNALYFVNFADQNIYVVDLEQTTQEKPQPAPPRQLTSGDANRRYADLALDEAHQQLLAVCEQHLPDHHEPQNLLVGINLADGKETELHTGHDFYAAPRICPQNEQVAFIAWDHPHMPWDETVLYRATLKQGQLAETQVIEGAQNESISQPGWLENGALIFSSDRAGFWNLHRYNSDGSTNICRDDAEYTSPNWIFGIREHTQLVNGDLAVVRQHQGLGELCVLATNADTPTSLNKEFAGYHALCSDATHLYALADRTDGFSCLIAVNTADASTNVLRTAGEFALREPSLPEAFAVTNRSGLTTHAWLYLPKNATNASTNGATADERPPLLVLSHGGPTSATSPALNPRIQYYTSRGWAVADVNYGGSTGYGRAYRERLRNNWGLIDVHDCEDVALALAEQNRVDPKRMAIKGGSAGGYTTLAALTFGNVFAAGASHYGIGDLNALAAETHKFEARYVDGLIPKQEWEARSPINAVDSLSCPVIFFQGSEDAVVPPGQAQAMVKALKAKGLPVAYVEFAGEGHGFRKATNIQQAAAAEYQFFCSVFGIECPDSPVDLEVENLP